MNNLKTLLTLLIALSFGFSQILGAQDSPPSPRTETESPSKVIPNDHDDSALGHEPTQQEPEEGASTDRKADQDESKEMKSDKKSESTGEAESQKNDEESSGSEGDSEAEQQESAKKTQKSGDQKDADQKDADQIQPEKKNRDKKKSGKRKSNPKKADQKKSDDKKKDDEDKSDEKKADEKKADEEKADEEKADEEKADEEKADEEKADEEKDAGKSDDDEKSIAEKALDKLRLGRSSRDQERINSFSKQSNEFVKIFEPVVASVNESTLTVVSGKRPIALGTVVDSNGLILTKASEMRGSIGCKLNDGTILDAKVIGIDPATDLALLKVDAENLNVAQWSDDTTPVTGRWVATPKGTVDGQPTIGVVSVNSREIPPSKPFIGIQMRNEPNDGGVVITMIVADSPADRANLWVNDLITSIDGEPVKNNESVRDQLGNYDVNDRITLGVQRGEKKMEIRLTLGEKDKIAPEYKRSILQNSMGSILSRRRKNFPDAFQHDSMLTSKTCGGPVVDLSGKIVGINIARSGRVESLAIPAYLAREIVESLKTGKLAPEIVNKESIERITAELKEMEAEFGHLPDKKIVLERKYNVEKARMDELNKTMAELRKRIKVIEEKSESFKAELSAVQNEIKRVEKTRQRLEADREQLRTGSR